MLLHGPMQNDTRLPSQEPEVNQVVQEIQNSAVASFPLAGGMRLLCAVAFRPRANLTLKRREIPDLSARLPVEPVDHSTEPLSVISRRKSSAPTIQRGNANVNISLAASDITLTL